MIILVFLLMFGGILVSAGTLNDYLKGASVWHAVAGTIAGVIMICMALYIFRVAGYDLPVS